MRSWGGSRRGEALAISSGDLIADRRYFIATDLAGRGDLAAAIDVLCQALERAPRFDAAWFALGELHALSGDSAAAIAAFRQLLALDPRDRLGAALWLSRLSGAPVPAEMSPSYVRLLFDQYAAHFDGALLELLRYRGPQLLRDAIASLAAKRARRDAFGRALDLGCGTGLAGAALSDWCTTLIGVDLSPAMIEVARRKAIYSALSIGDMVDFLAHEAAASADLVIAADAVVYVRDIAALLRAVGAVLVPGGLFAFSVETHGGSGVVLGDGLRYAHAASNVYAAVTGAGLRLAWLRSGSVRVEQGEPVPGLIIIAERAAAGADQVRASPFAAN